MGTREAVTELRALDEFMTTTSRVLLLPGTISIEKALQVIAEMPMDAFRRGLAGAVAREVGAELASANLRAADYAEITDVVESVLAAILADIEDNHDAYLREISNRLKEQG